MVIIAKIKLTSPILGELKKDHNGVRQLKKTAGRVLINTEEWREKFKKAARILGTHINAAAIMTEPGYECPTLRLYRRRFNQVNVDIFESISKGTVLTLKFAIADLPKAPTSEQIYALLETMGTFMSLSQWGEKYGYGRFEVLSVESAASLEPCTAINQ